jgi:Effector-associated domain 7/NB-ARC domain
MQNNEISQEFPVVVGNGNVYITPQNSTDGVSTDSSRRTKYTFDELSKENNHNLPHPSHNHFVGREKDLNILLNKVSTNYDERTITIVGIGGVGKTALALEAAYACLAAKKENNTSIPNFDLIVFSSAQLVTLSPRGIVSVDETLKPIKTLQDLCVDIDETLKKSGFNIIDPENQRSALLRFFSSTSQKILLILDNLEALEHEDIHQIYEFLKEIKGHSVKTIITTRNSDRYDLNLKELSKSASLEMIDRLLSNKELATTTNFREHLHEMSGGVPLAIYYAIGVVELSDNPNLVLEKLTDPTGDLAKYCFDRLVQEIKTSNYISFKLLVSLSISPYGLTQKNLFSIANICNSQEDEAIESLNTLKRCSLVFYENSFNKMLPLTRKYALSKLESNRSLEIELREFWIKCYIEIATKHGGEDRGEWHLQYDVINNEWKNFRDIMAWCKRHQKYEEAQCLWKYLSRFSYLYGYWSDRLNWSKWLIDAAKLRGDNKFLAELESSCGWLALLREGSENLSNAELLLKRAWNLNQYCDPYIRNTTAINLAVLYMRRLDFKRADYWFKKYMEFRRATINEIGRFNKIRLEIRYLLYFGEKFYREGCLPSTPENEKIKSLRKAKRIYNQVTRKSEDIEWLRFKVKAFERLASLAIKDNELEKAEQLLDNWYPSTQQNRDYRRMAFFERDYADLEFAKQNYEKAKEWANKALGRFQDLEMIARVEKINNLISECNINLERSQNPSSDLEGAILNSGNTQMKSKNILRIVIASPGDVQMERDILDSRVIPELNRGIANTYNLVLELGRWETDAYPGFHINGPQGLIDGILKIDECDILIGIFWKRFGTAIHDGTTGTQHEFLTAYQAWKTKGSPEIMMYFKEKEFMISNEQELEQLREVLKFKNDFPSEGLYWKFKDADNFERQIREHLTSVIKKLAADKLQSIGIQDDQATINETSTQNIRNTTASAPGAIAIGASAQGGIFITGNNNIVGDLLKNITDQAAMPDPQSIRQLIEDALSDEDLSNLCYEHFRKIYNKFTDKQTKDQRILLLAEYAERQLEVPKLLMKIEQINPNVYAKFQIKYK